MGSFKVKKDAGNYGCQWTADVNGNSCFYQVQLKKWNLNLFQFDEKS